MFHLHHTLRPLLEWLAQNPNYGELATFIITFSESIAIFGLIVPGSFLLAAIGGLIGSNILPLWPSLFSAVLGAIIGDTLSFSFGYYFSDNLSKMWPFSRYPNWLIKGRAFFDKHGGKSVFIGRFMGPLRPITPIVAGTLRMPYFSFVTAAILSAWIWAPAYMLPGYIVGAASVAYPHQHFLQIFSFSLLFILIAFIAGLSIQKIATLCAPQWERYLHAFWKKLLASPFKSLCTVCQKHGILHQVGQLNLLLVLIFSSLFLLWFTSNVHHQGIVTALNQPGFGLFQHHHTPGFHQAMLYLTTAGKSTVFIITLLIFCGYLCLIKENRLALHFFLLLLATLFSSACLKHFMHYPRPPLPQNALLSFSYPSGHTTLTGTFFGFWMGLLYLYKPTLRKILPTLFGAWILLIAFSRLYLGAHWLTDVAGGLLLAFVLVTAFLLSWRREITPIRLKNKIGRVSLVFLMIFLITWQLYFFFKVLGMYLL